MLKEHKEALGLIDKMMETEFLDSLEDRKGDLQIGSHLDLDYLRHPRRGRQEGA